MERWRVGIKGSQEVEGDKERTGRMGGKGRKGN